MFSKISRYRKLAEIVTIDAKGRRVESKDLRLLPDVSGTFSHIIEGNDRLDHLAYKYYKQPRKWWRICDANPDFMSPSALLGKDPLVTTQIPLSVANPFVQPPWAELQLQITKLIGVKDLRIEEEVTMVEEEQVINGTTVTVNVPQYTRALVIVHNEINLNPEALVEAITSILTNAGYTNDVEIGRPQPVGRVGKKIIIPPNTVG